MAGRFSRLDSGPHPAPGLWVLGLTGPSGSGKSTVCALLRQEDFGKFLRFIDADQVSRQVAEPNTPCLAALVQAFGREILRTGGSLDRHRLGNMVFGSPEQVEKLNRTILPFIVEEIRRRIEAYAQEEGVRGIVLDAPTLFESGADRMCSRVASVLAPREDRAARICARDGISLEAANKRLDSQLPASFYRTHSDFILWNGTRRDKLMEGIRRMAFWLELIPPREYRFSPLRRRQRMKRRSAFPGR